jgi:hypothetical protein
MAPATKQRTRPLESLKHQQASLPVFSPSVRLTVGNVYVVRPGKPGKASYHPRKDWREIEYAQAALHELHPAGTPRGISKKVLLWDVNKLLATDPNFRDAGFGEISLSTLKRALKILSG